jgi:hypothetical protein
MMLAWGILIPIGAFMPRFFKNNSPPRWFHLHRICQMLGVIFSFVGFILGVGIVKDTEHLVEGTLAAHFGIGTTVFVLSIVIVLLGLLRPDKSAWWRPQWFLAHVWLARIACILAFANIFLGLKLLNTVPIKGTLSSEVDAEGWQTAWIVIFVSIVLTWLILEVKQGFMAGALAGHEEADLANSADKRHPTIPEIRNPVYFDPSARNPSMSHVAPRQRTVDTPSNAYEKPDVSVNTVQLQRASYGYADKDAAVLPGATTNQGYIDVDTKATKEEVIIDDETPLSDE